MRLLCIGDIAILRTGYKTSWNPPLGKVFGKDSRILFNWELPIGIDVDPNPRKFGGPRLLSTHDSLKLIANWAPGFSALATNHILDAGVQGLIDTITSLEAIGFTTFGAGLTSEQTGKPVIWNTDEGKLGIINWVFQETGPDWMTIPGPNCWPGLENAKKEIINLKQTCNWVMIFAHWSDEYFPYPRPEDRLVAKELADVGLDLFIGHHPHVVRGMETINSCPVFYSIGNFYFSEYSSYPGDKIPKWAPRNREALGIQINFFRGRKPEYELISFIQKTDGAIEDRNEKAKKRLQKTSVPFTRNERKKYQEWYEKEKRIFFLIWAKWHFGIKKLGFKGFFRYLQRKIKSI